MKLLDELYNLVEYTTFLGIQIGKILVLKLNSVNNKKINNIIYYVVVEFRLRCGMFLWMVNKCRVEDVFLGQKRMIKSIAGITSTNSFKKYFKQFNFIQLVLF